MPRHMVTKGPASHQGRVEVDLQKLAHTWAKRWGRNVDEVMGAIQEPDRRGYKGERLSWAMGVVSGYVRSYMMTPKAGAEMMVPRN